MANDIVGSATMQVTFSGPRLDTAYEISLTASAAELLWWSDKTVNGFVINSSNDESITEVSWHIVR